CLEIDMEDVDRLLPCPFARDARGQQRNVAGGDPATAAWTVGAACHPRGAFAIGDEHKIRDRRMGDLAWTVAVAARRKASPGSVQRIEPNFPGNVLGNLGRTNFRTRRRAHETLPVSSPRLRHDLPLGSPLPRAVGDGPSFLGRYSIPTIPQIKEAY